MNKNLKHFLIILCIGIIMFIVVYATIKIYKNINFYNKEENVSEVKLNLKETVEEIETKSYEKEENISVPLSNSNVAAGKTIFKEFTIKENDPKLNLDSWNENNSSIDENKLYYKKVTSYLEYKKIMESYSSLRPLIESDFENYFAVIVVSPNIDKALNFNYIKINDDVEDPILNIDISYKNAEVQNLLYSGIVVIMSNWHKDFILNPQIME